MRYLATAGFSLVAFLSIIIVHRSANPDSAHIWWALVLLLQPAVWFRLVGHRHQWTIGESIAFVVIGVVGGICHYILMQRGILEYNTAGNARLAALYLGIFWASAGISVLKLGGTIFALTIPGRFDDTYLSNLEQAKTGHPAIGGVAVILLLYLFWLAFGG